jgi:predicted RNA binding protein YcfA (HicA-like mRNA interferase family)
LVIKALSKIGFEPVRQRGSHLFMMHPDGRSTVIPIHSGEELGRGVLKEILNDAGMSNEEFLDLLGRI